MANDADLMDNRRKWSDIFADLSSLHLSSPDCLYSQPYEQNTSNEN